MSSIKRVFLTFFTCLILLFSFLVSSSALDNNTPYYNVPIINFSIPEPDFGDNSGYAVFIYKTPGSTSPYTARVVSWYIVPYFDDSTADEALNTFATIQYSVTGTNTRSIISAGSPAATSSTGFIARTYTNGCSFVTLNETNYPIAAYNQSSYTLISSAASEEIYNYYGSLYGVYYKGNVSMVTGSTYGSLNNKFFINWGEASNEYLELQKIDNHFISMLQKQDFTNEQLVSLLEQFQYLLESVYNIDYNLYEFIYTYWYQFQSQDFPYSISEITNRLDKIYNLLNKSGDTEQTTVDSSKVDEYIDIEQSLVNNDEAESALNEFDISIDGQSYNFIWTLITDILNSHPEVFGLVITILTLGFLALILNR